jgi:hypothetical protein
MAASLSVKGQTFVDSPVERSAGFTFRRIGIRIHDQGNTGMRFLEPLQQMLEFCIDDDRVDFRVVENVRDIILFQAIVDRNVHCAGCSNAVDRLQESGRIGREDSDSFELMLQQEICQSARTVCCFLVRPSDDLLVCCDMVYGTGFGFDCGSTRKEDCRR